MVHAEHIAEAFDHFRMIAKLHGGEDESAHQQFEAVKAYMEFLGMDEEAINELSEQTTKFVPDTLVRAYGWVFMGFLIGVTATQQSGQPV